MRTVLMIGLVLTAGLSASAASAACGSGKDGAAMCGKPSAASAKMSTTSAKSKSTKAAAFGGCECCKNMAMLKGMGETMDMPAEEKK